LNALHGATKSPQNTMINLNEKFFLNFLIRANYLFSDILRSKASPGNNHYVREKEKDEADIGTKDLYAHRYELLRCCCHG